MTIHLPVHSSSCARTAALVLLMGLSGLAQAQATAKADGQFRYALGLGASLSSGNTKSSNLSLVADGVRLTDQNKTSLYANAQYARSAGTTTGDQLRLGGRYDHNLNPELFAFGGLDFDRNKFANLNLRSQLSGGLGWHAVKNASTTWDLFGGLGYTSDKYSSAMLIDGSTRSSYGYLSLLLGEESSHKLSATTSAKQRLVIVPNLKNRGEFRANWDAGLAVAMSSAMNLNVGLSFAHNSEPGPGRKATDTPVVNSVSVKFD
jgi:putative salt-induced outer membrane protein